MEDMIETNLENTELAIIGSEDEEDPILTASFVLPNFDDIADAKVIKSVKDTFRGFSFNASEDLSIKFASVESLSQFARATIHEISETNRQTAAGAMLNQGACAARYWCLCCTINQALSTANYGTGAHAKLAELMGYHKSYIYKLQKIATKLTMVQSYLLGIRGVKLTTMRRLANDIIDDDVREGIIKTFIDMTPEGGNSQHSAAALAELNAAINNTLKAQTAIEVQSTDPSEGGNPGNVTPEFDELAQVIGSLDKVKTKSYVEDKFLENINRVCENFYLMSNVPDADQHLEDMRGMADKAKVKLQGIISGIEGVIEQLESLKGVALTRPEDMRDGADTGR